MRADSKIASGLELVNEVTELLESVAGLSRENARTVTYWVVGTHGQTILELFPILVIQGDFGTGKSTLMRNMRPLCGNAALDVINVKESSNAFVKTLLQPEHTAFLDESDTLEESILIGRYHRKDGLSGKMTTAGFGGWQPSPKVLYGATVISRRTPFREYQIRSRAILIYTERKTEGEFHEVEISEQERLATGLKRLAQDVEWSEVPSNLVRVKNNWAPLLAVAVHVDDSWWLPIAEKRMEADESLVDSGTNYEPKKLVYTYLLASALDGGVKPKKFVLQKDVKLALQRDDYDLNQVQIGQLLREAGFKTDIRNGMATVFIEGEENLRRLGLKLGIEDEWLTKDS